MELMNKFEEMTTEELATVDGGMGVLAVIGYSVLAGTGAGIVGYGVARIFG
ncbi:Blp family class II bacteriocin [Streptococcus sp. sy010]|uniref:Blp family class II bacteriocin n=1 Tax=Streptococcus sp. sy010 TaxID=2600148 RepID=UPI0011B67706|nr:Blp family class II bacteriocin [Streptococcus sp. sy010]TWT16296.1 class IIb bacteriocin, lactobin A/cerein 7B family [Streptococcus sp. sy010]